MGSTNSQDVLGYLAGQILAALTLGVERAGWRPWPRIGTKAAGMLKRARGSIGRQRSLPMWHPIAFKKHSNT